MRFYRIMVTETKSGTKYQVYLDTFDQKHDTIEVTEAIKDVLVDLQREYWRLEKREQRHTVHLDAIPEAFLPITAFADDPEQEIISRQQACDVRQAFFQIPEKQQRRMLMKYILDYSICEIAEFEGCSTRAVKYSLQLAKKNMQDILGSDFMSR